MKAIVYLVCWHCQARNEVHSMTPPVRFFFLLDVFQKKPCRQCGYQSWAIEVIIEKGEDTHETQQLHG